METTKQINEIIPSVLTATQAPSTPEQPNNTIYQRFKRIAKFNTFNEPELERLLDETARFAASINFTTPYWLTLSGHSGVGKTMLAKTVYRQFMDQNRFELKFDRLRNRTYGNTGGFYCWRSCCSSFRAGAYELIEDICDEWFVILDDVGSERDPTGFIASALDQILNARQHKWTLITTNLSLREIANIDARISSRMLRNNGVVLEVNSQDYALRHG